MSPGMAAMSSGIAGPAGRVPVADLAVLVACPACGSHSRIASAAGAASQPSVSPTEPPVRSQSGTATTDPVIAPTDSAVM
jgi:hypothetical protein